jgi:hypothetical protein
MKILQKWSSLIALGVFALGLFLGPGSLWHLIGLKQNTRSYELDRSRYSNDLRNSQYDALMELLRLRQEHEKEVSDADKLLIEEQVKIQKGIFYKLEYELALAERRSPREIYLPCLEFDPIPPVTNARLGLVE